VRPRDLAPEIVVAEVLTVGLPASNGYNVWPFASRSVFPSEVSLTETAEAPGDPLLRGWGLSSRGREPAS
jgi:hypothetical protein